EHLAVLLDGRLAAAVGREPGAMQSDRLALHVADHRHHGGPAGLRLPMSKVRMEKKIVTSRNGDSARAQVGFRGRAGYGPAAREDDLDLPPPVLLLGRNRRR